MSLKKDNVSVLLNSIHEALLYAMHYPFRGKTLMIGFIVLTFVDFTLIKIVSLLRIASDMKSRICIRQLSVYYVTHKVSKFALFCS